MSSGIDPTGILGSVLSPIENLADDLTSAVGSLLDGVTGRSHNPSANASTVTASSDATQASGAQVVSSNATAQSGGASAAEGIGAIAGLLALL
jgi:hypothetical protein